MLSVLSKQDSHSKVLDEIQTELKSQRQITLNKYRRKILDSLGHIEPENYQKTNFELRQQDTGDWFVNGPYFRKWMDTKNAKLWLHGIRRYPFHSSRCSDFIIEADRSLNTKRVRARQYWRESLFIKRHMSSLTQQTPDL